MHKPCAGSSYTLSFCSWRISKPTDQFLNDPFLNPPIKHAIAPFLCIIPIIRIADMISVHQKKSPCLMTWPGFATKNCSSQLPDNSFSNILTLPCTYPREAFIMSAFSWAA